MIRRANQEDKQAIVELYKKLFPYNDGEYIDYLFEYVYEMSNCIVAQDNDKVVGFIVRVPFNMMLHSRYLKSSRIIGPYMLSDYQNSSLKKELMDMVMDLCAYSELITITQEKDDDYASYGFNVCYQRQQFILTREHVKNLSVAGLSYKGNPVDMLRLYGTFMAHFDGYDVREINDFKRLIKRTTMQQGKIIYYYDQAMRLKGYATLLLKEDCCIIDEIVYLDSITLIKLLSYALLMRNTVSLTVSNYENISHLLNDCGSRIIDSSLIRINDIELYNRLYNTHISDSKEIAVNNKKPMNRLLSR